MQLNISFTFSAKTYQEFPADHAKYPTFYV